MDLLDLTALQLGAKIRAGEVSVQEATRAALDAIAANNGKNNAFITLLPEQAMEQARRVQRQIARGELTSPLAGVPLGIKDDLCTRGVTTTCASRMLGEFVPPYDAAAVERIKAMGGVVLGKLNMDEFAMGSTSETSFFGPVRNPWDLERAPGGSSGGAAAAVAARECWYAIGSDTGGSIRQPAAFCGITGVKPTYGRVSRYGLIAYASSLDQVGPLARTAQDCAAILDVISGLDPRDATCLAHPGGGLLSGLEESIEGVRIGMPVQCFENGVDDQVRERVASVAQTLSARGARAEEFELPMLEYALSAYYIIACAQASSNLSRYDGVKYGWRGEKWENLEDLYCNSRTLGFGTEVKRRILLGTFVLSSGYYDAYYRKALKAQAAIRRAFERAFERYDMLLLPVTPQGAPKLGESLGDPVSMYQSDVYTVCANLAGLPALSIPCGFDRNGMPIGAQLMGPALGEGTLLRAAWAYQQETDWHLRTPAERGGGM